MSVAALSYRSAELVPGATAPPHRPRWLRLALWGLAGDALFTVAVFAAHALR